MPAPLTLNDGHEIPAIGLGLYLVPAADAYRVVRDGIAAGYRLIDGAAMYDNEAEQGAAIRDSGIRDELTVTTKFWGDPEQGYDAALRDFDERERTLGIGRIDCYLIHWPRAVREQYVDTWRAFVRLRDEGRVRSIGVSNFDEAEIARLADETGVLPALNQVETHPWLPQHSLRAFHREHGIVTQAWSPLGRGKLLSDPTLAGIAASHGVSVAQVILRWHLQLGGGFAAKSLHPERLAENLDLDGFTLDDAAMAAIAGLETGERTGRHPKDRP